MAKSKAAKSSTAGRILKHFLTFVRDANGLFEMDSSSSYVALRSSQPRKPSGRSPSRRELDKAKANLRFGASRFTDALNSAPLNEVLGSGVRRVEIRMGVDRTPQTLERASRAFVEAVKERKQVEGSIFVDGLQVVFKLLTKDGILCEHPGVREQKTTNDLGLRNEVFGEGTRQVVESMTELHDELAESHRKIKEKVQKAVRSLGNVVVNTTEEGKAIAASINQVLQEYGLRLEFSGITGYVMFTPASEDRSATFHLRAVRSRNQKSLRDIGFSMVSVVSAPPDLRRDNPS